VTQPRLWRRGPDGEILRAEPEPGVAEAQLGGDAAPPALAVGRARIGLAFRLGLRDAYDYLGSMALLSVAWTLVTAFAFFGGQAAGLALFGRLPGLLPGLLALLCAGAAALGIGGPLLAGVYRFARNAAARREPELFDLAWGFRSAFGRSAALAAVQAGLALVLVVNCYFYVTRGHPVVVALGAVFGYGLLFWSLMCLYQWPLLVEQTEAPAAESLVSVLKKSALLALDNFGYTLVLALPAPLACLCGWAAVGTLAGAAWMVIIVEASLIAAALLGPGVTAMFLTQATRELLRKYRVLPPDPTLDPMAGETHELGGYGWHE
jgi:uncharacterized membrane protein YesL